METKIALQEIRKELQIFNKKYNRKYWYVSPYNRSYWHIINNGKQAIFEKYLIDCKVANTDRRIISVDYTLMRYIDSTGELQSLIQLEEYYNEGVF
jgi:hypothetical protein